MFLNILEILHTIFSCSLKGGNGHKKLLINWVLILCCPAVPVKFLTPLLIKYSVLHKSRMYSGNISEYGLNICNSVVPEPILLVKLVKITDFLFSKQGVIFAIPMSLFIK